MPPATVFLFIGMSNWTIEIGGGNTDAWMGGSPVQLTGQPCATFCPNLSSPPAGPPYNQVDGDPTQLSFLYQLYPRGPGYTSVIVGPDVVAWDGARGAQTLDKWDPNVFYSQYPCPFEQPHGIDPVCNFDRVQNNLIAGHYSPLQVQTIFLKATDSFPQCDLSGAHCTAQQPPLIPDAYQAEQYMGNILRFLKLGATVNVNGVNTYYPAPHPNLKQVFLTSRIYGGYAKNPPPGVSQLYPGCLSPSPFDYEEGFSVQRLIVAQIDQTNGVNDTDPYSGQVDYSNAPWFDWGPYLWASADTPRSDGLFWCGGQGGNSPCQSTFDVRQGNLDGNPYDEAKYWGDYTHPNANGQKKVANLLVQFVSGTLTSVQKHISDWVTPWIQQ